MTSEFYTVVFAAVKFSKSTTIKVLINSTEKLLGNERLLYIYDLFYSADKQGLTYETTCKLYFGFLSVID